MCMLEAGVRSCWGSLFILCLSFNQQDVTVFLVMFKCCSRKETFWFHSFFSDCSGNFLCSLGKWGKRGRDVTRELFLQRLRGRSGTWDCTRSRFWFCHILIQSHSPWTQVTDFCLFTGDVSPISMSPISQSQFIPLGEVLLLAISAMNSAHKPVTQEALTEHLQTCFPGNSSSHTSTEPTPPTSLCLGLLHRKTLHIIIRWSVFIYPWLFLSEHVQFLFNPVNYCICSAGLYFNLVRPHWTIREVLSTYLILRCCNVPPGPPTTFRYCWHINIVTEPVSYFIFLLMFLPYSFGDKCVLTSGVQQLARTQQTGLTFLLT